MRKWGKVLLEGRTAPAQAGPAARKARCTCSQEQTSNAWTRREGVPGDKAKEVSTAVRAGPSS